MSEPPFFEYDPTLIESLPDEPGATRTWMILHHGQAKAGDRVLVAEGVTITDAEGHCYWSQTGELRESTVVDDTPPTQPGS